ncbi:unnamed protein product [Cyclocybe aegerita]|uniref:Uncharacterized protein n=1 Tax=Cyclocybe aegerita TaxID=1973307 RepID=A0A8S0W0F9_CYCAE|nr:unnamed protein product [Cyclocybe aegerita]
MVLRQEGFPEDWLSGLLTSDVCDFSRRTPRAGIVVDWTCEDKTRPDLHTLKRTFANPNLPLASIVMQRFLRVNFVTEELDKAAVQVLKLRRASSAVFDFVMDMYAKDIENSNDVNTNDTSDRAVLSKGLREIVDAARERQRLEASDAASLPFQTMINRDDSTSGDLCGDWQHFLDQRAARQTELIEHGGRNFRNWIKQREENPPRWNTNIFTWSRIISSGGKEIFMRTRVEKRRHDNVFNEYTPAQCRYNALENEWDLFEEFALEVKSKNGQDYAGYEHSDSEDDGFDPFEGYKHLYTESPPLVPLLVPPPPLLNLMK